MPELTPGLRGGLRVRYDEPHRGYHDNRHLDEVLAAIDRLTVEWSADADRSAGVDLDVVRAAAWYHDAVYDPRAEPGHNEEASARLAEAELGAAGWADPDVDRVAALVRLTATHRAADPAGELLADADLAILASGADRYAEYAADVRREYAHVPARDFARGRAAILQEFLDREWIYATAQARDDWELAARANLTTEIRSLTPVEPPP